MCLIYGLFFKWAYRFAFRSWTGDFKNQKNHVQAKSSFISVSKTQRIVDPGSPRPEKHGALQVLEALTKLNGLLISTKIHTNPFVMERSIRSAEI